MAKLIRENKLWVLTALVDGKPEEFSGYDLTDCFRLYACRIGELHG